MQTSHAPKRWIALSACGCKIKLRHLVTGDLPVISHCDVCLYRFTRVHIAGGKLQTRIREMRIAKAVAKAIERLAFEVAIRAVLQRIIIKRRQLIR